MRLRSKACQKHSRTTNVASRDSSAKPKLLASVNHPAIATLYALEDVDGARLLVMELVEGEDLAARLKRGPLSNRSASLALDELHSDEINADLLGATSLIIPYQGLSKSTTAPTLLLMLNAAELERFESWVRARSSRVLT